MKFTYENSWLYKYPAEIFNVKYDFTNEFPSGDTIASCWASIYDNNNVSKNASMMSNVSASSPRTGKFRLNRGVTGETYSIKIRAKTSTGDRYIKYITCEVFGNVTLNTNLGDMSANSYITLKEANDYIRNKYGHDNKWDTLDVEGKKRLLIESAKEIDSFSFIGQKYYDSQALQFPRDDHEVKTGNCGTPFTTSSFRNSTLKSSTYNEYPTNFFAKGTIHITTGTPLYEIRNISKSNVTTGSITLESSFSASPTINSQFKLFFPLSKDIKDAQSEQTLFIAENQQIETLSTYKDLGARSVAIGDVAVSFGDGSSSEKTSICSLAKKLLSRYIRKNIRIGRC